MSLAVVHRQVPDDLLEILDYLAERSPAAADRFASAVMITIDRLAEMPGLGSPKRYRDRRLSEVRSGAVAGFPNYLVYYRPIPDGIFVLAVLHGARRIPSVLRSRAQ